MAEYFNYIARLDPPRRTCEGILFQVYEFATIKQAVQLRLLRLLRLEALRWPKAVHMMRYYYL